MFKSDLFKAVESRNLKKIKSVLKKKPDAIHKTKDGNSPLHLATELGFTDVMEILIQNGCNINKQTSLGLTPLHIACSNDLYDAVVVLIEHGVDSTKQCSLGNTPLHEVARIGSIKIMKLLFNYGVEINAVNYQGWSALHRAVFSRKEDVLCLLCTEGIDVNIKNKDDRTAYEMAVYLMYYDLAELIKSNEKRPDFPTTVISTNATDDYTNKSESLMKIEESLNQVKDNIKTFFTWKTKEDDKSNENATTSSNEVNNEIIDSRNNPTLTFFQKIANTFKPVEGQTNHADEETSEAVKVENSKPTTPNKNSRNNKIDNPNSIQPTADEDKTPVCPNQANPMINNSSSKREEEDNDVIDDADKSEVDEEMHECPVCFEIPMPPIHIYQCTNGHLYCGNCKEMPNMFNCPQCGVDIASASSRNRYAEENIARLYGDKNNKNE